MDTELIDEQNKEYEKCLMQDFENQIRKQQEAELERIRQESWILEKQRKKKNLRESPQEVMDIEKRILLRLLYYHPDQGQQQATKIIQRFCAEDTLDYLYDYVETQDTVELYVQCRIYTIMPRKLLLRSKETLQEVLGGCGSYVLHVEIGNDAEKDCV
jgi:hypothetical protein